MDTSAAVKPVTASAKVTTNGTGKVFVRAGAVVVIEAMAGPVRSIVIVPAVAKSAAGPLLPAVSVTLLARTFRPSVPSEQEARATV